MPILQTRRRFVASVSAAAGAAGRIGTRPILAAEGPPGTTTIRLARYPSICLAPGDIADDLLRAEGFTDVRYIPGTPPDAAARGELDFAFETAAWVVSQLDAGEPITALSGEHSGCYELFAHEPIQTISELKGKKLGTYELGRSGHLLLAVIAAQVGLDPHKDVEWVTSSTSNAMELFAEGKVDAFLGFPPSRRSCAPARSAA